MSPPWGKEKDKILLPKGNVGSTYSNAKDKFFLKEKKKKVKERKKLGQGFRVFTIIGKPKRGLLWVPHITGGPTLVWSGLVWFPKEVIVVGPTNGWFHLHVPTTLEKRKGRIWSTVHTFSTCHFSIAPRCHSYCSTTEDPTRQKVTSFGISLSLSSRRLFFVFLVATCDLPKALLPSLIVAGTTSGHDGPFLGFLFLLVCRWKEDWRGRQWRVAQRESDREK
jgi:hypothetical protein